jgi:hypothetical protein
MADPRNIVGFEGLHEQFATFIIDNSTITFDATLAGGAAATMIGKAVGFSADKTIQLVGNGDFVLGKLLLVEQDLKATVQVEGCMSLPGGSSATLTDGTGIVGALGAASARGFIRSAASTTAAELLLQNGKIWDASDPTNTVVRL